MKHIKLITKVVSMYRVDKFYSKTNTLTVATGGSFPMKSELTKERLVVSQSQL